MLLLNRVIGVAEPNWKNREGLGRWGLNGEFANCSGRELGLDTQEIPDLHFCSLFFLLLLKTFFFFNDNPRLMLLNQI